MKKVLIIIAIILVSLGGLYAVMNIFGPSDVVLLTPEQEKEEEDRQTAVYKDMDLSGFSTVTVTGDAVTSSIFKDYKITMVNIWTTTCGPCIEEMPDIETLYKDLPEGTNIISICTDTAGDEDAIKFAAKVMQDAKAEFMTLVPDEVLKNTVGDNTNVFPTTIFVDSAGKVVGAPHFGKRSVEDYRQSILDRMALLPAASEAGK